MVVIDSNAIDAFFKEQPYVPLIAGGIIMFISWTIKHEILSTVGLLLGGGIAAISAYNMAQNAGMLAAHARRANARYAAPYYRQTLNTTGRSGLIDPYQTYIPRNALFSSTTAESPGKARNHLMPLISDSY